MKLIFCPKCFDVFRIYQKITRECRCGKSWGTYIDNLNATYGGNAVPLGISNFSFTNALGNQPTNGGAGKKFEAFVIPKKCKTFKKEQ